MGPPDVAALQSADVVLVRHGQTEWNVRSILNGDPTVAVPLTASGRSACEALQPLIASVPWRSVFVTRFARTRESLDDLWPGHPEPAVCADLDDISLGELEGGTRASYREWRHAHGVAEAPPGGESRLDALRRYARGLAYLADAADHPALVVTHDQPIRYLVNALAGDDPITGPAPPVPNASVWPYAAERLRRGADAMGAAAERLAHAG
jgi:broad specificity phosphatase PhoE